MFCIIDGQHMAHRHYYSKFDLGLPWREVFRDKFGVVPIEEEGDIMSFKTGLVYGFLQSLKSLQDKFNIEQFFIAWEGGELKRLEAYPEYKGDRGRPNKPYFMDQYRILCRLLSLIGVRQFATRGYEADDICAAMAKKFRENSMSCIIVSGDHDLFQCVTNDDFVRLLRPSTSKKNPDILYNYDTVKKKFGIGPENLKDIWAISGDDSDYIKGVKGIGEVTALKIMQKNGVTQVEKLLDMGDSMDATETKKTAILAMRNEIIRNKGLVTLYEDCDIDESGETEENSEALEEIFRELAFSKYLINFEYWENFCKEEG